MADRIQIRRDTDADWTSNDPTLAAGEFGYVSDTNEVVIGDGSTAYSALARRFPGGLREVVTFTSSGTFTKGNYPWLRYVLAHVQGAGGQGGGAQTTGAGEGSFGDGGGGGGYSLKRIAVADLSTNETVTIGAGGSGGTTVGNDGGNTTFAGVTGEGGGGGGRRAATTSQLVGTATPTTRRGGVATGGDLNIRGEPGDHGIMLTPGNAAGVSGGNGGSSVFGSGGVAAISGTATADDGTGYGGGGGGNALHESQGASVSGGDGADGIVVLYLFA